MENMHSILKDITFIVIVILAVAVVLWMAQRCGSPCRSVRETRKERRPPACEHRENGGSDPER